VKSVWSPLTISLGIVGTVLLAALSLLAVAAIGGTSSSFGGGNAAGSSCTAPNLSGTVVDVTLINMGGPMMDRGNGMMSGGAMRLSTDRPTVAHGEISFLVTNGGSVTHELVVLPLDGSQIVGTRSTGGDGKINEASSVGEASKSCGSGTGQGVLPGTSGWVTMTLPAGRYELVCNFPGHYQAGMYSQLTVN
jgi:uncharacterized cupredoxin-like copper-binding protein